MREIQKAFTRRPIRRLISIIYDPGGDNIDLASDIADALRMAEARVAEGQSFWSPGRVRGVTVYTFLDSEWEHLAETLVSLLTGFGHQCEVSYHGRPMQDHEAAISVHVHRK